VAQPALPDPSRAPPPHPRHLHRRTHAPTSRLGSGAPSGLRDRIHQAVNQKIQVGQVHAGQTVAIDIDETTLRMLDPQDELIAVVPRTNTDEVRRFKVYDTKRRSC
jgi:hypothetical protein